MRFTVSNVLEMHMGMYIYSEYQKSMSWKQFLQALLLQNLIYISLFIHCVFSHWHQQLVCSTQRNTRFSLQVQGFTDSSIVVQIFWAGLALGQKKHKVIHCKIRPELIQPQASIGRCLCSYYSNLFVKIKKSNKALPTFSYMFTLGELDCWCKFSVWVCLATLTRWK